MSASAENFDRLSAQIRPEGKAVGYQNWWDLLFLHWRVPAEQLRSLIPDELSIDEFDGSAWVGMVLFRMNGVRPSWFPALPWLSAFPETNVRTYVRFSGENPGVWFFSLDASCLPAVKVARWKWHLNYHHSQMSLVRNEQTVSYCSRRTSPAYRTTHLKIEAEIGSELTPHSHGEAVPGTLEHFLAERYRLYTSDSHGGLHMAQVHHPPYPLRAAKVTQLDETLLAANDIFPSNEMEHAMFSEGVKVEIFPLREL